MGKNEDLQQGNYPSLKFHTPLNGILISVREKHDSRGRHSEEGKSGAMVGTGKPVQEKCHFLQNDQGRVLLFLHG